MNVMNDKKRVLIVGATGMLGHTLFHRLANHANLDVAATARSNKTLPRWFAPEHLKKIYCDVDADNFDSIVQVLNKFRPDVVLNCIGIIKQLPIAKDPVVSISMNALFPHRLAGACKTIGARMIHFSTDCVFSGSKGNYTENDPSDADDLYGRTKFLGEVSDLHCITLRTSIIGHELRGGHGLIDWFLAQEGTIRGFTKAIYTGFPTVEIANIISQYVIPNKELSGLYQISSAPISKYDLLQLVAERYGKRIEIEAYDGFHCDRSLDSNRFRKITGYAPPSWPDMIEEMWRDYQEQHKLTNL
jgi:dTDP-4-dehydrorhamnose reductase